MAFALIIVGLALLVAAARNKQDDLFSLVKGEFSGQSNFIFWLAAIFAIGAVGYIPKLKPLSSAFLALVIIVLFIRKGQGFFSQLTSGLAQTTTSGQTSQQLSQIPLNAGSNPSPSLQIPALPSLGTLLQNAPGGLS